MTGVRIWISSGEGEVGTLELYKGKLTVRALTARLTRERCGGDRWARCTVGTDYETRRECTPAEAIYLAHLDAHRLEVAVRY